MPLCIGTGERIVKAVILAGGYGTRISEESGVRPKPMVEIGGRPILWHIMKLYAAAGITDFIICCGYKGNMIKEWALNYHWMSADFTIDMSSNSIEMHDRRCEGWRITLLDTGEATMTGGRIKRAIEHVDGTFLCTYGDGVSDVNIRAPIDYHRTQKAEATLTAVQPPGRFGAFTLNEGDIRVPSFREKPDGDGSWINGGFFVLEPSVADYIDGSQTVWEREPLETLAQTGNLAAFRHKGFWHAMDTLRDKTVLQQLWDSGRPPWKTWAD